MSSRMEGEDVSGLRGRLMLGLRGRTAAAPASNPTAPAPTKAALGATQRIAAERRAALSPHDGRRSKRPQPVHPVQLNLRVEADTKALLQRCADARGTSMIEAIEHAIALLAAETLGDKP